MGFLDKAKDAAEKAKDAAKQAVDKAGPKIGDAIDKGKGFVDDKTGGKYHDKLATGADKTKDTLDDLDGKNDDIPDTPATT